MSKNRKKLRQERKTKRQEQRQERKSVSVNSKAYRRKTRADNEQILAEQGIDARGERLRSGFEFGKGIVSSGASMFGAGMAAKHGGEYTEGSGNFEHGEFNFRRNRRNDDENLNEDENSLVKYGLFGLFGMGVIWFLSSLFKGKNKKKRYG